MMAYDLTADARAPDLRQATLEKGSCQQRADEILVFQEAAPDERHEMIPGTFSLPYGQAALVGLADVRR
jgi:hypothetical protein